MAEHIAEDQNHIQKGKILSRQKRQIIGCSNAVPCDEGFGDCDNDSDCIGDLECNLPMGQTGMDLCYCPSSACNVGM